MGSSSHRSDVGRFTDRDASKFRTENLVERAPISRADLLRECSFQARFPPSLDMWLWAQLAVRTQFAFVDEPLCHWRQHPTSYMKKEVDPARLDMQTVRAFHDEIRMLLPPAASDPHAHRARGLVSRVGRAWRRLLQRRST